MKNLEILWFEMKDFSISPKKLKNILKSYIDFFFQKKNIFLILKRTIKK